MTAGEPERARAVVDGNDYMTLATADAAGTPWASPVWFAHDGYGEVVWASRPDARHSRNVVARPEVGIVVFDSTVPAGAALAVYLEARARAVGEDGPDLARLIAVYSRRSEARGGPAWGPADVTGGAAHRLYAARVTAAWLLAGDDRRHAVALA
jgi:Pyridoxamine 5'-phosphate oxidase